MKTQEEIESFIDMKGGKVYLNRGYENLTNDELVILQNAIIEQFHLYIAEEERFIPGSDDAQGIFAKEKISRYNFVKIFKFLTETLSKVKCSRPLNLFLPNYYFYEGGYFFEYPPLVQLFAQAAREINVPINLTIQNCSLESQKCLAALIREAKVPITLAFKDDMDQDYMECLTEAIRGAKATIKLIFFIQSQRPDFDFKNVKYLAEAIRGKTEAPIVLDFSGSNESMLFAKVPNDFRSTFGASPYLECLAKAMKDSRVPITLMCSRFGDDNLDTRCLADVIRNAKAPINLDIPHYISSKNAVYLIEAIRDSKVPISLRILHRLSGENFRNFTRTMADIKVPVTLDLSGILDLSELRFTDKDAKFLATAIREAKAPMTLDLSRHFISSEGARYLIEAMRDAKVPISMNLSGNPIFREQDRDLKEILRNSRVPHTLGILDRVEYEENKFKEDCIQYLAMNKPMEFIHKIENLFNLGRGGFRKCYANTLGRVPELRNFPIKVLGLVTEASGDNSEFVILSKMISALCSLKVQSFGQMSAILRENEHLRNAEGFAKFLAGEVEIQPKAEPTPQVGWVEYIANRAFCRRGRVESMNI